MGIDGIEFHPDYHQNLGTIQKIWLFEIFFVSNQHPLVKSHFENTIGNPFFENFRECGVSPGNEHNSSWECVVQVGSVEKSLNKKHENRQSHQNSEK